jgi:hypothetical protein
MFVGIARRRWDMKQNSKNGKQRELLIAVRKIYHKIAKRLPFCEPQDEYCFSNQSSMTFLYLNQWKSVTKKYHLKPIEN